MDTPTQDTRGDPLGWSCVLLGSPLRPLRPPYAHCPCSLSTRLLNSGSTRGTGLVWLRRESKSSAVHFVLGCIVYTRSLISVVRVNENGGIWTRLKFTKSISGLRAWERRVSQGRAGARVGGLGSQTAWRRGRASGGPGGRDLGLPAVPLLSITWLTCSSLACHYTKFQRS